MIENKGIKQGFSEWTTLKKGETGMRNKKWVALMGATITLLLTACGGNETVMTVGELDVTKDELYEQLRDQPSGGGFTMGDYVLQQIMIREVFEMEYGEHITDEEAEQEFNDFKATFGSEEAFVEMKEAEGWTDEELKQEVRLGMLFDVALKAKHPVTEEMLNEAYEEMIPVGTRIAHILVDTEDIANEVLAKINNGENFEDLVHEYSKDTESLDVDGQYTLPYELLPPEFNDASLELERDEISQPVQTGLGYHVIKMVSEGVKAPLSEEKDQLIQEIYSRMVLDNPELSDDIIRDLISEYKDDIEVHEEAISDLVERILKTQAPE